MNKDIYNQPFCIIGSKGQFAECYQTRRYLPPLPHIEPQEKPPQDVEIRYIHLNDTRRVFAKLNALDGAVKYLLKEKEEQKGGKKYKYS